MAEIDLSLSDRDAKSVESLITGWCPTDNDLATYFLDEKALEDLSKGVNIPTSAFHFDPSSSTSSPISPYSQSPSSPLSDILSSPRSDNSSSDELEAELFSQPMNTDYNFQTESLSPWTTPTFAFDAAPSAFTTAPSAFTASCLPPLPLAVPEPAIAATPTVVAETKPAVVVPPKEKEVKKTNKRRRVSKESKPSKCDFHLSEEELLKFDGNEIEVYIKSISSTRSLSPAEEKEMKRIRRLIKNREYAQSSRDKKKQYVEEIEAQLQTANEEKEALQKRVDALEAENKTLKFHLARLLKTTNTAVSKSTTFVTSNKAVSMTMFVVLFSFGLFALSGLSSSPSGFSHSSSPVAFSTAYTGKRLLELEDAERNLVKDLMGLLYDYGLLQSSTPELVEDHFASTCHGELKDSGACATRSSWNGISVNA